MPFIIQGFGSEQRVQLGADEIIRPMAWGTNWAKIRIGMRIAINTQQTFANAAFIVGVCQGNTAGWTSTSTTDAIGISQGNIFTNIYNTSWGYFSAFGGVNIGGTSGICCGRKVGANYTSNTAVNTASIYCAAQPLMGAARSIFLVDISKNFNGTISATTWGLDLSSVSQDCSRFWLLYQMENETAPKTPANSGLTSNGAASLSVAGSLAWDNVFISWSRSVPIMEVCDVTVVRYY